MSNFVLLAASVQRLYVFSVYECGVAGAHPAAPHTYMYIYIYALLIYTYMRMYIYIYALPPGI